ncbi:hypothetical protein [Helicobacter trogontum]|uniref:Uncharacterized protein n=1 Tax=Helicobacter trogontum TaxID=50960 RepID=A0A4U8TFB9_9HELI|nr:hypothetical protein [Helicobacter trogontum]MDY5184651.1 hypothetical protein [Helicobacter trogontum]TLD98765.1 hypothetical protein LS80_003910 [Helicobacter trogontum]
MRKFFSVVGFIDFACAQLHATQNLGNLSLLDDYIGTFAKRSILGENKDSYGTINLSYASIIP